MRRDDVGPGFLPLARETVERMRRDGISVYHVHAPIDHHPEVSPSRTCAAAMGVPADDEYFPVAADIAGPCSRGPGAPSEVATPCPVESASPAPVREARTPHSRDLTWHGGNVGGTPGAPSPAL
jgi:hypothetical protein